MDCPHELCHFGPDKVALPYAITSDPDVLSEMLTLETWNKVLSPEERRRLMDLLPGLDRSDHRETLEILFTGRPMHFTNPVGDVVEQIRSGRNQPDVLDLAKRSIRRKRREFRYRLRNYYYKLLKTSLVSRNNLLEAELANNSAWTKTPTSSSSSATKKKAESLIDRVEKRVTREMRLIDLASFFSAGKKSALKLETSSSSSSPSSSADSSESET